MKRFYCLVSMAVSLLSFIATAHAQSYPAKPIRLVVPYPPGDVDITARQLQSAMQADLISVQE